MSRCIIRYAVANATRESKQIVPATKTVTSISPVGAKGTVLLSPWLPEKRSLNCTYSISTETFFIALSI